MRTHSAAAPPSARFRPCLRLTCGAIGSRNNLKTVIYCERLLCRENRRPRTRTRATPRCSCRVIRKIKTNRSMSITALPIPSFCAITLKRFIETCRDVGATDLAGSLLGSLLRLPAVLLLLAA